MDIYGKEYVIDHCQSEYKRRSEERIYRIYITDALKVIAENTTHFAGVDEFIDYGSTMSMRWADVLEPQKEEVVDDRPCADIAHEIWERIRGTSNDSI